MNTLILAALPFMPEAPESYPIVNLILMFFLFSLIGFVWEVIYITITEKVTANRGMLHGPWLPIYGIGGVIMVLMFAPYRNEPLMIFVVSALMCSTIEYITAIASERVFGCRWWDYSNKRLNLKGRICLAGALLFGSCGIFGACYFGPILNSAFVRVAISVRMAVAAVLCAIFIVDVILSFKWPNKGTGVTYPPSEKKNKN